jgi:hypothetical protein
MVGGSLIIVLDISAGKIDVAKKGKGSRSLPIVWERNITRAKQPIGQMCII